MEVITMKLSDAMREKMLLSFELFPPKTEKGMANMSREPSSTCASTNRSTFPVHTEQAAETWEPTEKYVR